MTLIKEGLLVDTVNVKNWNGLIRTEEGWKAQLNAKKLKIILFFYNKKK